jgi:hypothetical protein
MNASTASLSTTETITDPATLARVLREIVELTHSCPRSQLPVRDPFRKSLSRVEARAVWLLLNLCSSQLASREWVSLHSRSLSLRHELLASQGE